LTQQGIENIKQSPARLEAAKKAFKEMDGQIKQNFLVMGQYDMVIIGEAPDDETAARLSLVVGSKGSVRTETMRAFTEEEYRKIIEALPCPYMSQGQGNVCPPGNNVSGQCSRLCKYFGKLLSLKMPLTSS
jgi:uncharacterized protein with GYD domain